MKLLKKRIGKLIQRRRKEMGFKTQEDLAEAIGADQPTVARWEAGTYFPNQESLRKLCDVLNVERSFFETNEPGEELFEQIEDLTDKIEALKKEINSVKQPVESNDDSKKTETVFIPPEDFSFLKKFQEANDLRRSLCQMIVAAESEQQLAAQIQGFLVALDAEERERRAKADIASQNKTTPQAQAAKRNR